MADPNPPPGESEGSNDEPAPYWSAEEQRVDGYETGEMFALDPFYTLAPPKHNLPPMRGASGFVVCCLDTRIKKWFAVKICSRDLFRTVKVGGRLVAGNAARLLRELSLMHAMSHPHIIAFHEMMSIDPAARDLFNTVRIVLDWHSGDLARSRGRRLEINQIQQVTFQVARAIKYLHACGVIHRDIKPENILVDRVDDVFVVKVCDFGLARFYDPEDAGYTAAPTNYVVTRYYRAPDCGLLTDYSNKVDIWSIGVVVAEMLGGKVLMEGNTQLHQLELIARTVPCPDEIADQIIAAAQEGTFPDGYEIPEDNANARYRASIIFERVAYVLEENRSRTMPTFEELIPRSDSENSEMLAHVYDLLRKTVTWRPEERLTADEILHHPFFGTMYNDLDEADRALDAADANLADLHDAGEVQVGPREARRLIYNLMLRSHPDIGDYDPDLCAGGEFAYLDQDDSGADGDDGGEGTSGGPGGSGG